MLPEPFISELEVRARLGAHIVAFHRRTQHDIVLAERLPSESPLQRERYVVLAGMGEVNGYDVDRVIGAWTDWRAVLGESRVRAGDIIVEVSPRQWWPEGERP